MKTLALHAMIPRMIQPAGLALLLICMAGSAGADPVLWDPGSGGNAHFYEAVATPDGSTWAEARQAAQQMTWQGMAGQLASVTSAEENAWIWEQFGGPAGYWLGGLQQDGAAEPDGGWQWLSGDLWAFTAWDDGQPDNSGDERFLQYALTTQDGLWNDYCTFCIGAGFIVEFLPTTTRQDERTWGLIKALF